MTSDTTHINETVAQKSECRYSSIVNEKESASSVTHNVLTDVVDQLQMTVHVTPPLVRNY